MSSQVLGSDSDFSYRDPLLYINSKKITGFIFLALLMMILLLTLVDFDPISKVVLIAVTILVIIGLLVLSIAHYLFRWMIESE